MTQFWRLSEPGEVEWGVGVLPGLFELALDEVGGGGFVLMPQGCLQSEKAPGVARPALEVVAEDLFGAFGLSGFEEGAAEGGSDGDGPEGGFHVGQGVFGVDGGLEELDLAGVIAAGTGETTGEPEVGDIEGGAGREGGVVEGLGLRALGQCGEGLVFGGGVVGLVFGEESEAAGEVPEGAVYEEIIGSGGLGFAEEVVPLTEAGLGEPGEVAEAGSFDGGGGAADTVDGEAGDHACGFEGVGAAAFEELGPPEEVHVMRVIGAHVEALGAALADVVAVGFHGAFISDDGVGVLADAHVDMGGHVDEVTGVGDAAGETIGGGEAEFGLGPGFDGVDVEVIGAGMIGVSAEHGFERVEDLLGFGFGMALVGPIVPGHGVHEGLGEEGQGVGIIRVLAGEEAHAIGESEVEVGAILDMVGLVTGGEGVDVGLFSWGDLGFEREGVLEGGPGAGVILFVHGTVDMGAGGEGDAPVGHGALGIELGGGFEGADGFAMIEGEGEGEALVEVALSAGGGGGHRMVEITETGEEGGMAWFPLGAGLLGHCVEVGTEEQGDE